MRSSVRSFGPCGLLLLAALSVSAAGLAEAQSGGSDPASAEARLVAVNLYQGGLAWLTWEAEIAGEQIVRLRVQRSSLDDLLASLSLAGGATVRSISYPVSDTLARRLDSLPVDPGAGSSLASFLAQQRGAVLSASGPAGSHEGRLLAVDSGAAIRVTGEIGRSGDGGQAPGGGFLVLQTNAGIRSIPLTEDLLIRFADPSLNAALTDALAAIASERTDDIIPVELRVSAGDGPASRLRIAWLQEAPAWKASYRIDHRGSSGELTAFAIVDNPGATAWEDVQLTLETGAPVSFRMPLSDPFVLPRPELPVPLAQAGAVPEFAADLAPGAGSRGAPPSAARSESLGLADAFSSEPRPQAAIQAAAVAEDGSGPQASQRYRIVRPVTLEAGASALVPLVLASVDLSLQSVFDHRQDSTRPYRTLSFRNSTGLFLPAGPVTLISDSGFGGSAVLPALPDGAEALLALAVDSELRVTRLLSGSTTAISRVTASRGVLRIQRSQERRWTWRVESAATRDVQLLVVEPLNPGWDLADISGFSSERIVGAERRLGVSIPAGSDPLELGLTESRITATETAIGGIGEAELVAIVESGAASTALSAGIRAILDLRAEIAGIEQQIRELDSARNRLFNDQARIRDNLNAVGTDSDLGRRYLAQLQEQEDQLAELQLDRDRTSASLAELRRDLADRIEELNG